MSGYFVTGGTMSPDVASYVERSADGELFAAALAGEYCSVLTTRQMGKSSLMARTAARLRAQGVACATVDLQGRGDKDPDPAKWYYGVVKQIADGLGIGATWTAWWRRQDMLLPSQRMTDFFSDVALKEVEGRVVVFIDEVDWMIRLPFSDEFFAAIRSCYNRRSSNLDLGRLSFVLLGSAAPAQLIKDATRTPFNIGRAIELTDFTADEVRPLAQHLGRDGERLLARILHWTDGHPYLTQMLCAQIEADAESAAAPEARVDALVERNLLRRHDENNLKFVADRLTQGTSDLRSVLRTYRQVLRGRRIVDVPASPIHTSLRLSGVVKADAERRLQVRNAVYRWVFDQRWIRRHMPWNVRAIAAAAVLLVGALSGIGYYAGFRHAQTSLIGDEAARAGRDARSFPPARENYFADMDGGRFLSPDEVEGRNTWMVWTAGNDRFWNTIADGARLDLLKTISTHPTLPYNRGNRFQYFGVVNEPCYQAATGPDPNRFGLWLDTRDPACPPDPFADAAHYPGVNIGARGKTVPVGSYYGEGTGIVGLRLFPNPDFDEAARKRWDPQRYYTDPFYYSAQDLVRPFRVGMSCAFCHVGPDPTHPPADPEHPGWKNLSPIVGAQYLRPDRLFTWAGFKNEDYFFQVLHTWRPGTVDMSSFASDGINNPHAINGIYSLAPRLGVAKRWGAETVSGASFPRLTELARGTPLAAFFTPPTTVWSPRFQADASDSTGVLNFITRFYLTLGVFSEESLRHFVPFSNRQRSTPLDPDAARSQSTYFQATEAQSLRVVQFLLNTVDGHRLKDAPGGTNYLTKDRAVLARGATAFADHCAQCHSSKLPEKLPGLDAGGCAGSNYLNCWNAYWAATGSNDFKRQMRRIVAADDFLVGNYLSADFRVPIPLVGTNACGALGTSTTAGGIWDRFSSESYKDLPSAGEVTWSHPATGESSTMSMPGGGRGYSRAPSLVSIWATAPFLSNNSVGTFEPDASVDARLRAFDNAMMQLLTPATRPTDPTPTGGNFPGIIDRLTVETFLPDQLVGAGLTVGPIPRGTPVGLFANLDLLFAEGTPAAQKERQAAIDTLFNTIARRATPSRPPNLPNPSNGSNPSSLPSPSSPPSPLPTRAARPERDGEIFDRPLVDTLLSLSKCRDFVVNRGHTFGADLPDADKRALIEFMKTF